MSLKGLHTETYILLALMVFFGSLGNVLLSRGMKQTGEIIDFSPSALAGAFVRVFTNGSIWLGIASLLVFFASYLLLLSWADFSYVQPASAIGYALVAAGVASCTLLIPQLPAPLIALVLGLGALAEGAFALWLFVTG